MEHYDPKDPIVQKQITTGIRALRDACDYSTNELQTVEEICARLRKEFAIDAYPRFGGMEFR